MPLLFLSLDNTLLDRAGAFRAWGKGFLAEIGAPDYDLDWLDGADADGMTSTWDLADAIRDRLARQREAGVLREDVPIDVLAQFLELAYDGLVLHLATGRPPGELNRVLDLVEEAVRRR